MSDFLKKTYMVCNQSLLSDLKKLEGFKLNLGLSLLNSNMAFNPQDVNIQTHGMFHNELILSLGFLGSLQVYTCSNYKIGQFSIINEKHKIVCIDYEKDLYSRINIKLKEMALITGYIVETKEKEKPVEKTYIKPNKSFAEMTLPERVEYARNLK